MAIFEWEKDVAGFWGFLLLIFALSLHFKIAGNFSQHVFQNSSGFL